jgi:nicotinamidase-related amidase
MALDRPIGPRSVHLCIDMQRLLAREGPWPAPWSEAAMPRILQLIERRPADTIFTRFMPPANADQMPGTWRRFYRKWRNITRDNIDPQLLELIPPLDKFVPPAWVVDKTRYSAFIESTLSAILADRGIDTLIFSGAETDVCVLATLMAAVDRGYRVIVASDAICSSSDVCHDALITLYQQRFSEQVEIAETVEIVRAWSLAA